MSAGSEYHWRQIAACADERPGLPLSSRPFLRAALRSHGYIIDGEMAGAMLKAVCQGAMVRRAVVVGEDD